MAGITPDISVSSFKPLSLDEIMMVPLAKQKQEDEAILALDQLDAMRSNALQKDQGYVSGQIDAFQAESDDISNQILNQGVDRNLINKVRGLRSRKNAEFSVSGKTGQAAAAFNQHAANKAAILKRKDLTEDQKRLGVAKSLENYAGVEEAGIYEDYIGASFVDVMKKGRDIAAAMKPEERASVLNMEWDPQTETYRDGTKSYKKLTPNHIKQVVYGALKGDQGVGNYLRDIESLGQGSAEEMIRQAAISAGDVYQVSSIKDATTLSNASRNPNGAGRVLQGDGASDLMSNWTTMLVLNGASGYNRTLGVDKDTLSRLKFDKKGILQDLKYNKKDYINKGVDLERMADPTIGAYTHRTRESAAESIFNKENKEVLAIQKAIHKIRTDDPQGFAGKTDKYILESYVKGMERANASFATIVRPRNNLNSFYNHYTDKILGTNGRVGDITSGSRSLKVMGKPYGDGTPSQIADQLGFDDIKEFNTALTAGVADQGKAVIEGMVNDPDIPMGIVVHMKDGDGVSHRIVVSPEAEVGTKMGQAATMMRNLKNGVNFEAKKALGYNRSKRMNEIHNEFYINKAQNIEGFNGSQGYIDYTPLIIRSKADFTEAEAKRIEWDPSTGRATLDGEYLPGTSVMTYDEQVSQSMNTIAKTWDTTYTQKNKK